MILVRRSFHAFPRRFVGFNNASIFCLVFSNRATGLPVLATLKFAVHCSWHRNFQLSTRIFHKTLEFLIIRINEVNTTQFFSIVELRFFDSPLLLFFAFRRIRHIFPNLWPQSVWSGCGLVFLSVFSQTMYIHPSGGFSSNTVNLVTLSTYLTILDLHQRSNSHRYFSSITSKDVFVVLVTSMYFSGIGNDASLGTYSLTLGST